MIKHSLVIPCYNEEDNVRPFFEAVVSAMKGYTDSYELVFVNDGSKDKTQQELKKLFEEFPQIEIQVIVFSRNFGKEAAMYAGLQHARGEYVTIIDADLQQRPEVAVEMGKILDEKPEYDIVAAFQAQRKESPFLSFCKKSFYFIINKVSEVHFIPGASDFRTLRRNAVDAVLSLSEYHRFSKGLFSFVGFESYPIPYEVQERTAGQSKWNFFKLFRYAMEGILAYTYLPLKFPLYFGIFCLLAACLLLPVSIIVALIFGAAVNFLWWIELALVSLGIISVNQGILGMYLGKIHTQVKQRPIYLTKEILRHDQLEKPLE